MHFIDNRAIIVVEHWFLQILKTFTRSLDESDWSRLDFYGPKIQFLGSEFFSDPTPEWFLRSVEQRVDQDALAILAAYRPVHSLLPNLRKVKFGSAFEVVDLTLLPAFIGSPSLTHVVFAINAMRGCHADIPQFLRALARTSPNIEVLKLESPNEELPNQDPLGIDRLLSELKNLRILHIGYTAWTPSPEIIRHLATINTLSFLARCRFAEFSQIESLTTQENQFPDLRRFHFETQAAPISIAILNNMARPFEELLISVLKSEILESYASILGITNALARHRCLSSLTKLDLSVRCQISGNERLCTLIRPLFSLRSLKNVSLAFRPLNELDDAWFVDASTSWPHLECLSLNDLVYPRNPDEHPNVTLAGILPLVRSCPHLRYLRLSLKLQPFPSSLASGISNSRFRSMAFIASPVTFPEKVSRCLT